MKYLLVISEHDDFRWSQWEVGLVSEAEQISLVVVEADGAAAALAAYGAFINENGGGPCSFPDGYLVAAWPLDGEIVFDGKARRNELLEAYEATVRSQSEQKERGTLRALLAKYPDEGSSK